ncbi:MAG: inorganic triphosphatase [Proteobacteria bacterium]|nr:MAG: inorganic triphosphatase [Pseudomonadota bacterium]
MRASHELDRLPLVNRERFKHGVADMAAKELELKLELPPATLPALNKLPLFRRLKFAPQRKTEVSVYFDTQKHKLRKKGLMLRVRHVGNRYVQTIKASGNSGSFERDEWEAEISGNEPELRFAKGTALEPLAKKKLRRRLKPMFETRVRRTLYPLRDDRRAIALTIDRGTIDSGTRSTKLCEIELELQRGNVSDLFDVARDLIDAVPAGLAVKSKSERGYELLEKKQNAPARAGDIHLQPDACARDAFQAVGRACLKQVLDNRPALIGSDPEGVHQMRVGLRRLRAAMSLFGDLLRDDETAAIKAELKWLTGELGPARELEVLMKRVVSPTRKQRARWPGLSAFSHELAQKREAALGRAQDAVQSSRYRALTLDVAAWLEAGQWRRPADDLVRDRGDVAIAVFAAAELARRRRKVRKKGRALAELDAKSRHKLRIQTKKVRYAAEFFRDVFPNRRAAKRRKKFLSALEPLQDALGDLNDIAVHEQRMEALGLGRGRTNRKEAFAAGVLTGQEDARAVPAMEAGREAYADFARCKPFW